MRWLLENLNHCPKNKSFKAQLCPPLLLESMQALSAWGQFLGYKIPRQTYRECTQEWVESAAASEPGAAEDESSSRASRASATLSRAADAEFLFPSSRTPSCAGSSPWQLLSLVLPAPSLLYICPSPGSFCFTKIQSRQLSFLLHTTSSPERPIRHG